MNNGPVHAEGGRSFEEKAWNKAASGLPLTRLESEAVRQKYGFWIEPTAHEVPEYAPEIGAVHSVRDASRVRTSDVIGRKDVQDLLTGENVSNISLRDIPNEIGFRLNGQINSAVELAKRGLVDISGTVREFDRLVAPGFIEVFSTEERLRLTRADEALCMKLQEQFARLVLGDRTEELITRVDGALKAQVRPLLPRVSPLARESIERSLELWGHAMQSPYRNWYYRTAQTASHNPRLHHEYAAALAQHDPHVFSAGIMDDELGVCNAGAGYCSSSLMMFLREPLDGQMTLPYTLAAIHELVHAKRTARDLASVRCASGEEMRKRMDELEAPFRSSPDRSAIFVRDQDAEAYGNEIELLMAKIGFGTHNVETLCRSLGLHPDSPQARHIVSLMQHARHYYAGGGRKEGGECPAAFCDSVEAEYRRLGARIYYPDPNAGGGYVLRS